MEPILSRSANCAIMHAPIETIDIAGWLSAKARDAEISEYTNTVTSHPTPEFMQFLEEQGSSFEEAAAARQAAGGDHNRRETPLFARSIERWALG